MAFQTGVRSGTNDPVKDLFYIDMHTDFKCAESDESFSESVTESVIKCNIDQEVNHLGEGIKLATVNDREKNSEALGRSAVWKGTAKVTKLPPYLTVQLMRFFFKQSAQQRAKIMKKVCGEENALASVVTSVAASHLCLMSHHCGACMPLQSWLCAHLSV